MNILFNITNVTLLAAYLIDGYSEKGAGIALTYFVIFFIPVIAYVSYNIVKIARGKKRFKGAWSLFATLHEIHPSEENTQIYQKILFDILQKSISP